MINDEIVAIVEKLLEYKCISKNSINNFQLNVIYYTQRKSEYVQTSKITRIIVCTHKYKH